MIVRLNWIQLLSYWREVRSSKGFVTLSRSFGVVFLLICLPVLSLQGRVVDASVEPDFVDGDENIPVKEPQIVNGTTVTTPIYPWMAALVSSESGDYYDRMRCGAVLIHPYWILTAAHCTDGQTIDDLRVIVGGTDLENPSGFEEVIPKSIIQFPDYFGDFFTDYDISLILLEEPLINHPVISLVSHSELEIPGVEAKIMGWGNMSLDQYNYQYPTELQEATISIVSNEFLNQPGNYNGYITDTMIGAGLEDPATTTLYGDSGGPLIVYNEGQERWELVGLTSFGAGCGTGEFPFGVFCRVSAFKDWIEQIVYSDFSSWLVDEGKAEDVYWGTLDSNLPHDFLLVRDSDDENDPNWEWRLEPLADAGSGEVRQKAVLDLILRRDQPHLEFVLETSTDLQSWTQHKLNMYDFDWQEDFNNGSARYHLPVDLDPQDQGGSGTALFNRFKYTGAVGYQHGPYPMRVGDTVTMRMTMGQDTEKSMVYDYLVKLDNPDDDLLLELSSDDFSSGRTEVYDYQTGDLVFDSGWDSWDYLPDPIQIPINSADTFLIRLSNRTLVKEPVVTFHTDYVFSDLPLTMGSAVNASLSTSDPVFIRADRYVDSYRINVGRPFLITADNTDFDILLHVTNKLTGEKWVVDNASTAEPETYVVETGRLTDYQIRVSSFNASETGQYRLNCSFYNEPTSIDLDSSQTRNINIHDSNYSIPSGYQVYYDEVYINNPGYTGQITVWVEGFGDFVPPFDIWNISTNRQEEITYTFCYEDQFIVFYASSGVTYSIDVYGTHEELNSNFRVEVTRGDNRPEALSSGLLTGRPGRTGKWKPVPIMKSGKDHEGKRYIGKGRRMKTRLLKAER